MFRRCLAVVLSAAPLVSVASARVVVDAATSIVIDRGEPGPLQKAGQDRAADFERVFGRRGSILRSPTTPGAPVIWIALDRNLPTGVTRPSGWESLRIQTAGNAVV